MENKRLHKCRQYIERIQQLFIDKGYCTCGRIDVTADPIMRIVLDVPHGRVVILAQLYISSMRLFMFHSQTIDPTSRNTIQSRMKRLNGSLSNGMGYGFSKIGAVAFDAGPGYAFRHSDPQDDAGLEGFCELIGKTAPARIDELTALGLNGVEIIGNHREQEREGYGAVFSN